MTAFLRTSLATFVASITLFIASTAVADGEACYNDIDCPGTACGDAVCNWNKIAAIPMGQKVFACNPAGTQPAGEDGWCTTDADCKCRDQGATCVAPYCTFTKPMAGSTGGAPAAAGGTPATPGGTSSTGGSTSSPGGMPSSTGGAAVTPAPADDGGCSVSAAGRTGSAAALGVGLLALGFAFARRRCS